VISLLMTMLSSFFRDSTSMGQSLAGQDSSVGRSGAKIHEPVNIPKSPEM
jgi:hypothetical protein